jgi:PPOX class probable F420-dependent enzyme
MQLNDAAREFIGDGVDATLITLNPDGSPQVSVVWVALRSTADGDELVTAHLAEHKKVRNIRRDPRVAVTIVQAGDVKRELRHYLSIEGTAHIEEGGAPELLVSLSEVLLDPAQFPPKDAPPGFVTHIRVEKVGGIGPWS